MTTQPIPLTEREDANLSESGESGTTFSTRFQTDLSDEELKRRRLEGRRNAIPKKAYQDAIKTFCRGCINCKYRTMVRWCGVSAKLIEELKTCPMLQK